MGRGGAGRADLVARHLAGLFTGSVLVAVDGEPGREAWTFWIGFVDADLTVLCAEGPDGVLWSPPNST